MVVPMTRTRVFWDLHWGSPVDGNYNMLLEKAAPRQKVAACRYPASENFDSSWDLVRAGRICQGIFRPSWTPEMEMQADDCCACAVEYLGTYFRITDRIMVRCHNEHTTLVAHGTDTIWHCTDTLWFSSNLYI